MRAKKLPKIEAEIKAKIDSATGPNADLAREFYDLTFRSSQDYSDKRDNANINTDSSMGTMLKYGAEASKAFSNNFVLPEKFVVANRENTIHLHDLDFANITLNCVQIDLLKLFHGGFSTGHGFEREPQNIMSYAALACIAIQSNQNDMFKPNRLN